MMKYRVKNGKKGYLRNVMKKRNIFKRKIEEIFPSVFYEINNLLEEEEVSIYKIAEVIKKDMSITTRLIRLANTPFYGFPGRIGTVEDALIILGLNVVKIIFYTFCAVDVMNTYYSKLCKHCVKVGEVAGVIAENMGIEKPGEIYTAGILHDFGKMVIKISVTGYEKVEAATKKKKCAFWQAEQEMLGVNHADVVKDLFEEWRFPERIIEMVVYHHEPWKSKNFSIETSIIHFSNAVVHAEGKIEKIREVPGFNESVFEIIGGDIMEIVREKFFK